MKFYEFTQNNSGGHIIVDEKVCYRIFIEAASPDAANAKAEKLGVYFNGCDDGLDCDCCGDRWCPTGGAVKFPVFYDSPHTFQTVEKYAQYLANQYGCTKPDCRIYYANGKVKEIFITEKKKRKK